MAAGCSFIAGIFLMISNIQGERVPDGHPLDPWWMVWVLLVIVPISFGFVALETWPWEWEEKKEEEEEPASKLYTGRSRHLLRP